MNDVPQAYQQIVNASDLQPGLVGDTGPAHRAGEDQAHDVSSVVIACAVQAPRAPEFLNADTARRGGLPVPRQ